ncbi:MAG TPA: hypothetical protein H9870_10720 [Candidatus Corynebacterium avicola]|uniref:Secreted protein n=1 Tax=Candidatus Corynebacterium avicola TaxID=2838527 RepID=A0A9D1RQ62_9CORY|nr:hypothetical protein [Candidatus Corynebacterium avicola]
MKRPIAVVAGSALLFGLSACGFDETVFSTTGEESATNAQAISVPANADLYRIGAIGPDVLNEDAEEGDPLRYVDPSFITDEGNLKRRMSPTEAQSLQVLSKINEELTAEGIRIVDVASVRVYLTAGPDGADYEGWERAYRTYFANIDPDSGESLVTPTALTATKLTDAPSTSATSSATSEPSEPSESAEASESEEPTESSTSPLPGEDNPTKPTVLTVGVADQPVDGWLVQVEVDAYTESDD